MRRSGGSSASSGGSSDRQRTVAVTGPYRFYDWHWWGRLRAAVRLDAGAARARRRAAACSRMGALLYGGNFAVRREALDAIGGFDKSIEFHGEDTNLGRRLAAVGHVAFLQRCWLMTSARRYQALGTFAVFRLYVRNFWSEIVHHRPEDLAHVDVRI